MHKYKVLAGKMKKRDHSNNSTNMMQQFHKFIYSTFMCGSTCFGRLRAHHQEHATALGASGLTIGEQQLEHCWSWSGRL
jgi:hypothetical protein